MGYQLHVSAGQSYDKLEPVRVNRGLGDYDPVGDNCRLAVRVQDFQGHGPSTCEYFEQDEHKQDQISIQLQVKFDEDVNADELMWGNDFDKPIRDILPWGFTIGYNLMKTLIDPTIDGDPYADKPYLYGRAFSSFNKVCYGDWGDEWHVLKQDHIPPTLTDPPVPSEANKRITHFAQQAARKQVTVKKGDVISFDFYTAYITLGKQFAIKLPGYDLNMERYCGEQPLRYTLKTKDRVLLCVVFDVKKV